MTKSNFGCSWIFFIQLFPNWTACSPITYTNKGLPPLKNVTFFFVSNLLFSWALLCWLNCFPCFIHLWVLQVLATRMSPNFRFRGKMVNYYLCVLPWLTRFLSLAVPRQVQSQTEAWLRRHSTHVWNLTDELSKAKERCLNQFGTAVLVRCSKSVKFNRVCPTYLWLDTWYTVWIRCCTSVSPKSNLFN